MIPNCNDGTQQEPYLRLDMNSGCWWDLPSHSSAPKGKEAVLAAIKDAGFAGVQGVLAQECEKSGLRGTGSGRVDKVGDAQRVAEREKANGFDCATLHVGSGLESDAQIDRLVADIIAASEEFAFPFYIETHRATITQDIYRTVELTRRNPGVRFNGDFSHWYTGLEMVYGDFAGKLAFAAPVFDRVRFIHGRIGNPGSIQVDIGDGVGLSYVEHFKEMWTRSFIGFLKSARPGDFICFTPELLSSGNYYALRHKDAAGQQVEVGDRWQQAIFYGDIARECFAKAKDAVISAAT